MQHNFWLAKPYDLAIQKLCYIQMHLNIEKKNQRTTLKSVLKNGR